MTFEELKKLVVKIRTDPVGERSRGAGFLVSGDGLALTCAHVVNQFGRLDDFQPMTDIFVNGRRATVEHHDAVADIALLRVKDAPRKSVFLDPGYTPGDEDRFKIFGFGEDESLFPDGATVTGDIAGEDQFNMGFDSEYESHDRLSPMLKLANLNQPVTRGFSGSPVFCIRTRSVVGVLAVDIPREGGEYALATPIWAVFDRWRNYLTIPDPLKNAFLDVSRFVGREKELELLKEAVDHPKYKMIVIDGLAGMGKSALVSKFAQTGKYCSWEADRILVVDCKEYQFLTDIYRRLGDLFEQHRNTALAALLKEFPGEASDGKYADVSREIIASLPECLLIFDNFECFLLEERDWEQDEFDIEKDVLEILRPRVETFFRLFLERSHKAKAIITSRFTPRIKGDASGLCRLFEKRLAGLGKPQMEIYAAKATDYQFTGTDWRIIQEKIAGHPQAFQFLCALLNESRNTVEDLLTPVHPGRATPFQVKVARDLLKKLYNRVTPPERRILETVCVIRKPFVYDTVESLLTKQDIKTTALPDQIKTLERRSLLARAGQNDWVVHAIVKDFLQLIIEKKEKAESLNRLAAEYYESNSPREIHKLSDVDFLMEAVYHYEKANCEDRHENVSTRLSTILQHFGYSNYTHNGNNLRFFNKK